MMKTRNYFFAIGFALALVFGIGISACKKADPQIPEEKPDVPIIPVEPDPTTMSGTEWELFQKEAGIVRRISYTFTTRDSVRFLIVDKSGDTAQEVEADVMYYYYYKPEKKAAYIEHKSEGDGTLTYEAVVDWKAGIFYLDDGEGAPLPFCRVKN